MDVEWMMDELLGWQDELNFQDPALDLGCEGECRDPWEGLFASSPSSGDAFLNLDGLEGEAVVDGCGPASPCCELTSIAALLDEQRPQEVVSPQGCGGDIETVRSSAVDAEQCTRSDCSETSGAQPGLEHATSCSRLENENCHETKSPSSESGCTEEHDNQPMGQGSGSGGDFGPPMDEEAKRLIRLMRNRESATQSRLRKKSYVKELEMKCRLLESHCAMLQQTVAFTSQENVMLRDELNRIKSSTGTGSKPGVVEPAALLSDSLPSESPPHLTASDQFLLANWVLLACLCHVLLLGIVARKVQSRAKGGNRGRRVWRPRRRSEICGGPILFTSLVSLRRLKSEMMYVRSRLLTCSSSCVTKGTKPSNLTYENTLFPASVHRKRRFGSKGKACRKSMRHCRCYDRHRRR